VSREIALLRVYLIEKNQKAAFVGHKLREVLAGVRVVAQGGMNQVVAG
jgi:hypothetical protein